MKEGPREVSQIHARLLKCGLEAESSRAFWSRSVSAEFNSAQQAFNDYWFGARSLSRTKVLLAEMKLRYSAFPMALEALKRLQDVSSDMRLLICHWHLQLTDPLYRSFTGEKLPERRVSFRAEITREVAEEWVRERVGSRWSSATLTLYASKLLSSAHRAGLISSRRDPRPLTIPRVPDDALEYLMYLLNEVQFEGTLFENPYVKSVGLDSSQVEYRLRRLHGLAFQRQGALYDFSWRYPGLIAWANVKASPPKGRVAGRGR
jgi:Putative inner membrane protein (DUF1819)